jgi:UDP-GlcNAc3NAcA epimerase
MLKLLTIIGARPQIIKSAAISRAIKNHYASSIKEVVVHTGQHYDERMSAIFFEELQIPLPDYNLGAGSGKHGEQTARMIAGIETILENEQPDFMIIYGDTNSTLAAAVAASKIHVPVVHIEAGLRSFNKKMPEEINRILSDHVSTYLFPPTQTGLDNLKNEGFRVDNQPPYTIDRPGVFNVGDVMYDNTLFFSKVADKNTDILEKEGLEKKQFLLVTLHRNTNTDDAVRLNAIFRALLEIANSGNETLVLPLHPRTAKQMEILLETELRREISSNPAILLLPPVSYLEMIQLEKYAKLVLTDSGGVQKEAYFLKTPCLILRAETEWVEIVESGAAVLCDADETRILDAYRYFMSNPESSYQTIYGDGNAAEKILNLLLTGAGATT